MPLSQMETPYLQEPAYGQDESASQDVAVSFLRWIQLTERAESSDDSEATAHLQACLQTATKQGSNATATGAKKGGKAKKRAAESDDALDSKASRRTFQRPPPSLPYCGILPRASRAFRTCTCAVACADQTSLRVQGAEDMKWDLREHTHEIRRLDKELVGRVRSLRYFQVCVCPATSLLTASIFLCQV